MEEEGFDTSEQSSKKAATKGCDIVSWEGGPKSHTRVNSTLNQYT
jgi:hypothetical protein